MTDHPLSAMREAHAEAHRAHLNARVMNHKNALVARLSETEPPAPEPVPPAPCGWVFSWAFWGDLVDSLTASQREHWGVERDRDPTLLGLPVAFAMLGDPILKGQPWRLLLDEPATVRVEETA